ncbi:MAG: hypothetical protein ACOX5J_12785 [Candidatus Hydrogenedentales bacterium]
MVIALGAVFSALEVVPLSLLGFEAAHNLRVVDEGGTTYAYKWPIYFFVRRGLLEPGRGGGVRFSDQSADCSVLFAGHQHHPDPFARGASFGVYGMLAISLMLFSVRHIVTRASWSDRLLKYSFWGLNGGLAGMLVLSLIPSGFYQLYYAIRDGLWYARSPEIASGQFIRTVTWLRMLPDLLFALGALALLVFLVRATMLSFRKKTA